MKAKKTLFFLLRLFITLGLLYYIYRKIDLKLIKNILSTSNYPLFITAISIFILSNITGAVQWYFLLRSQKITGLSFFYTIKIHLLSAFFNNFLPTNVGGDVVKVYKLIKMNYPKNIIFSSILWDRFMNIIILILFSLIAGILIFKKKIIFFGLLLFILIILLAFILIKKYNAGKFILKIVRKIKNKNIKYFMEEFLISFKIYLQRSSYILLFYITSLITQFLKVYFAVFIVKAMAPIGLNLNLAEIFFICPVTGIVAILPISINGLGIREVVGGFIAGYLYKSKTLISLFVTLGNLSVILSNLPGVVFFFQKGKRSQ